MDRIKMGKQPIGSREEILRLAPSLIEAVNADERLAILAAANPIMLMEDMGLRFTKEFKHHLERRFRFSAKTAEQLDGLEREIHEISSRSFDIDSPTELEHELFQRLDLPKPKGLKGQDHPSKLLSYTASSPASPLPPQVGWGQKIEDPLEELRGLHPIMEPLLEYRCIEAKAPRLAPLEVYMRIKGGDANLPVTKIKFQVKGNLPKD